MAKKTMTPRTQTKPQLQRSPRPQKTTHQRSRLFGVFEKNTIEREQLVAPSFVFEGVAENAEERFEAWIKTSDGKTYRLWELVFIAERKKSEAKEEGPTPNRGIRFGMQE